MAARDSRRECRSGSSLSLRERDFGVRVQSLLNLDAAVKDIPTLTPALSRRERVSHQLRQASRRPRWGFVKKAIEDTVLQGVVVRRAKHPMNRARLELTAD
jgi:hypothetical protein